VVAVPTKISVPSGSAEEANRLVPEIPSPPASLTGEKPGCPGMLRVSSVPMNRAQVSVPPPSASGMISSTVSPA
jgi:hypothetical protein